VFLNDAVADAKPQAWSLPNWARGIERIENAGRFRHAWSIVTKFEHHQGILQTRRNGERASGIRHGVESVVGDVQTDLQQLIRVAKNPRQFTGEVGVDLNIGATRLGQAELYRGLYQGIDVHQRLLGGNLLGKT